MLDVLRPEEEFTSAREIEALEIMLWEAVLAHAPAVERVLDAIERRARLRDARRGQDAAHGSPRVATRRRSRARSARAARKLRAADVDHLFIDAALGAIDRMTLGIGVRGSDVGSLGRAASVAEWLRRVQQRESRRRRRAQRLREGEPAPRRQSSRAASTTAAWRSPI